MPTSAAVSSSNEGRSGGYRAVVGYRAGDRAVFIYAFAKNERDNIGPDELEDLRRTGATILATREAGLARAIRAGELEEINDDKDE